MATNGVMIGGMTRPVYGTVHHGESHRGEYGTGYGTGGDMGPMGMVRKGILIDNMILGNLAARKRQMLEQD